MDNCIDKLNKDLSEVLGYELDINSRESLDTVFNHPTIKIGDLVRKKHSGWSMSDNSKCPVNRYNRIIYMVTGFKGFYGETLKLTVYGYWMPKAKRLKLIKPCRVHHWQRVDADDYELFTSPFNLIERAHAAEAEHTGK